MRNYKQIQLENVCYVHGCRIEGLTLEKGFHNLSAWINYLFFLKEKKILIIDLIGFSTSTEFIKLIFIFLLKNQFGLNFVWNF